MRSADLSLEGLPPPQAPPTRRLVAPLRRRVWQPARATTAGGGSVGSPPLCPGSRWGRGECPRLWVGRCSPARRVLGCWPDWLPGWGSSDTLRGAKQGEAVRAGGHWRPPGVSTHTVRPPSSSLVPESPGQRAEAALVRAMDSTHVSLFRARGGELVTSPLPTPEGPSGPAESRPSQDPQQLPPVRGPSPAVLCPGPSCLPLHVGPLRPPSPAPDAQAASWGQGRSMVSTLQMGLERLRLGFLSLPGGLGEVEGGSRWGGVAGGLPGALSGRQGASRPHVAT